MSTPLNIAIAAGGTAGHINPALALAEELRARGDHVTFFGQAAKLEGKLVPEAGFDFVPIEVRGIDRSKPWTAFAALAQMQKAKGVVGRYFSKMGAPDVAVGFGAYVEMPLLEWCAAHRVPIVLHEQNSVPGLANKTLARKAHVVAVSMPQAVRTLERYAGPGTRIVVTGNPVRKSIIEADRARGLKELGVPEGATVLLVFGGSLGASSINNTMIGLKKELLGRPNLYIVQSTGKEAYEEVSAKLNLTPAEAKRWQVVPYLNNMGDALAAADLVVSRAGASSIAEIAALAVPAILVPYPLATADHQTINAQFLVGAHAAKLVPDDELGTPRFSRLLFELLDSPEARVAMHEAALGLAQEKAAKHLADQTEKLGSL